MEIGDFAEKVCSALQERLGRGYVVESREVRKNNGVLLQGLLIATPGNNVIPTIYLESILEAYEAGMPFEQVIDRLLSVYRKNLPREMVNLEYFKHFEAVKDRICYRLVGRKGNEILLDEVPHKDFLDLVICFFYAFHDKELGEGSITIYNSHMEMWGTDASELFQLAQCNTPRLFPWKCQEIEEILEAMAEDAGEDGEILNHTENMGFSHISMKVLTNSILRFGASCILYPAVLEQIVGKAGRDLYIIPSSTHETILLPALGNEVERLKDIISCVNRTQVAPEEMLSDSLYYYDRAERKIKML